MIPDSFAPLFTGPGRHYWGRHVTSCLLCWNQYRRGVLETEKMNSFFRRAEHCENCSGTQRDTMPWTELFIRGRRREPDGEKWDHEAWSS